MYRHASGSAAPMYDLIQRVPQHRIRLLSPELLHHSAGSVQQKQMRLVIKAELLFILCHSFVVNIQIDELHLSPVVDFQPVNHRRKALADRSPEGKEFNDLRPALADCHRLRVCGP